VRPELVAEVRYDKVQGNRFRHGSRFIRFRDDKDPDQCTWREVKPARRKDDPTFESLLSLASA
jgi:ATP-dependent DNA ligase